MEWQFEDRDRKFSLGVAGSLLEVVPQRKFSLDALAPGFTAAGRDANGIVEFEEELGTFEESKRKGMAKTHYVDKKDRVACLGCNRKFSLKLRPRHCRRCGEIFCMRCLPQKTKLNKLACPDPSGKERKVCVGCFEASIAVEGYSRNLTEQFLHERTMAKYEHVLNQRINSLTTSFWRDQLDINMECRRLLAGFEHAVANSESRRALQELRNLVNTPTWQQSSYWTLESRSTNCRACKGHLGVRKQRRNCRVCGLALCKRCSYKELLIFYPDTTATDSGRGPLTGKLTSEMALNRPVARLAVINQPGAPDKEPAVSLLLQVCTECKTYIARHQLLSPEWGSSMDNVGPLLEAIVCMNNNIQDLERHISDALSRKNELLEEREPLGPDKHLHCSGLDDIDGHLKQYSVEFQRLKSLLPLAESKTQTMLIRNYIKGRHEFFMENKQLMARLRKRRDFNGRGK